MEREEEEAPAPPTGLRKEREEVEESPSPSKEREREREGEVEEPCSAWKEREREREEEEAPAPPIGFRKEREEVEEPCSPWKEREIEREEEEMEEPCSPSSRLFNRPELYTVIFCVISFAQPINEGLFIENLQSSFLKHKRFRSVQKKKNGREYWKIVEVNIKDHVIVTELPEMQAAKDNVVEEYLADLAMAPPLDISKPLWELHIVNRGWKDGASFCVLRVHHSLGDGTSLMSLFLASTRRVDKPESPPTIPKKSESQNQHTKAQIWPLSWLCSLWLLAKRFFSFFLALCYTVTGVSHFLYKNFVEDSGIAIKASRGVEKLEKCIAVCMLSLGDMRAVRKAAGGGTINDVLMAVISSGIRRYLLNQFVSTSLEKARITALAIINIRPSSGLQELADMMKYNTKARWGNHMGYLLLPISLKSCGNPLDYVRRAKRVNDRKKASYEGAFTYKSGLLVMNALGSKVATKLTYRSAFNSTLSISNVVGPMEEVMFAGNPIKHMITTSTGVPQSLCIHMLSYMGSVSIAIMASKKYIPEPALLSDCFAYAFQEMKQAASPNT